MREASNAVQVMRNGMPVAKHLPLRRRSTSSRGTCAAWAFPSRQPAPAVRSATMASTSLVTLILSFPCDAVFSASLGAFSRQGIAGPWRNHVAASQQDGHRPCPGSRVWRDIQGLGGTHALPRLKRDSNRSSASSRTLAKAGPFGRSVMRRLSMSPRDELLEALRKGPSQVLAFSWHRLDDAQFAIHLGTKLSRVRQW